ncbi:hypothetical protein K7X08_028843 [Anisodus acutangulus]|uniref:Deubiquitinating enzyme A n=1 Tax=Anisodus acutangulus TaxID=402998 RepID=A0A9Q1KZJ0_9SOLA|nr:hypothetical protein K7X08_028843 [Anisodus acutangulus]
MTRILVQRGSAGASSSSTSNQNRSSTSLRGPSSSSVPTQPQASSSSQVLSALKDDEFVEEIQEQVALEESSVGSSNYKGDDEQLEILGGQQSTNEEKIADNEKRDGGIDSEDLTREFDGLTVVEEENEGRSAICESEDYNSADEQNPNFGSSYDDVEIERQFEMDLRRAKGLEVKKMLEDGNCLFRAVADQVYGDSENYDLVRQMCIDYMERERDHFSQFITEGFTSYCKRKRRDKNQSIHSMEVIIPTALLFDSSTREELDKDQVKAAIKAQQDQQIDNALLAEGRFYSDLELTEKEIERMVMEASRAEYVANDKFRQQLGCRESSTSSTEPSSSGARSSGSETRHEGSQEVLSDCIQIMLSMGFSYAQVIEAYSIFGGDVDSMVCYLIETSNISRRKGKATE